MAYRGELEALQARIRSLEEQLARAEARARVVPLDRRLGVARRVVIEQRLEGELDDQLIDRVVAVLEESFGESGQIERDGASVRWTRTTKGKPFEVRLAGGNGRVELRARLPLESEHRTIIRGVAAAGVVALSGVVHVFTTIDPWTMAPAIGSALGLVAVTAWARRRRIAQLREVTARVLGLLEAELASGSMRVRVEVESAKEDQVETEPHEARVAPAKRGAPR